MPEQLPACSAGGRRRGRRPFAPGDGRGQLQRSPAVRSAQPRRRVPAGAGDQGQRVAGAHVVVREGAVAAQPLAAVHQRRRVAGERPAAQCVGASGNGVDSVRTGNAQNQAVPRRLKARHRSDVAQKYSQLGPRESSVASPLILIFAFERRSEWRLHHIDKDSSHRP